MKRSSPEPDTRKFGRPGPFSLLRTLLLPLVPLYFLGYRLDRLLKTLRRRKTAPGAFVVSVGNLTTGGTGKTPFVIRLAEGLKRYDPVILTRGYGSGARPGLYRYRKNTGRRNPEQFGDEPMLISKRTGARVSLDSNRAAGIARAVRLSRFFIMDDGFQQYGLGTNVDIVLLDASKPVSSCLLLPAGDLREPLSELKRADVVVITRILESRPDTFMLLKNAVKKAGIPPERVFACDFPAEGIFNQAGRRVAPAALAGKKILAFAGIAGFGQFRQTMSGLLSGETGIRFIRYSDHHRYTEGDLAMLRKNMDRGDVLVTTEKDSIKLDSRLTGLLSVRIGCHIPEEKRLLAFLGKRWRNDQNP